MQAVRSAVAGVEGVEAVSRPVAEGPPGTLVQATLEPNPYSTEAFDLVEPIREAAHGVAPGTLVGGPTAIEFDVRDAAGWDSIVIPPIILVVVLLILIGLLRAVVAPLILIGTVILSFLAALGVGYFAFDVIFGFPGSDPSLPLFAFVFLVALGVDYNIFLIARAREETIEHGSEQGILRALAVTGARHHQRRHRPRRHLLGARPSCPSPSSPSSASSSPSASSSTPSWSAASSSRALALDDVLATSS